MEEFLWRCWCSELRNRRSFVVEKEKRIVRERKKILSFEKYWLSWCVLPCLLFSQKLFNQQLLRFVIVLLMRIWKTEVDYQVRKSMTPDTKWYRRNLLLFSVVMLEDRLRVLVLPFSLSDFSVHNICEWY